MHWEAFFSLRLFASFFPWQKNRNCLYVYLLPITFCNFHPRCNRFVSLWWRKTTNVTLIFFPQLNYGRSVMIRRTWNVVKRGRFRLRIYVFCQLLHKSNMPHKTKKKTRSYKKSNLEMLKVALSVFLVRRSSSWWFELSLDK